MIKTVLLATLIPLGIILLIVFLVYLFGNVYNGLVRRRESVRSSYRELKKGFIKVFELIPSLTRGIVNDDKMKETFASLYSRYNSFDRENVHELASLSVAFEDAIRELKTTSSDKETIPFVEDSIRLAHFSIKFYNANVDSYNRFKRMFVNRTIAKIFKFEDAYRFDLDISPSGSTTIDLRVR